VTCSGYFAPIPLTEKDGSLRFEVHAKPKAKTLGESAALAVTRSRCDRRPPPVDGAANVELVRFLAELLDVPKRNVEIVRVTPHRPSSSPWWA